MWLNLSAAAGNEMATNELQRLVKEMSQTQIEQAQLFARSSITMSVSLMGIRRGAVTPAGR
jgi:hypothetical protein